jgi:hypothetical protein
MRLNFEKILVPLSLMSLIVVMMTLISTFARFATPNVSFLSMVTSFQRCAS